MQKKTIQRLAAAGVLSVAVAATLIYAGTRDPGESLTYNELLALAGDEEAAASVEAELEATSNLEENSALSRLLEEIEAEDASEASEEAEEADSAASEENTAAEAESEASTSSEAAASSKSEAAASSASSKTASSAVSGASHSTAAPERDYSASSSAHTASSAAHSTAASASHSTAESHATASSKAETTCDEQLAACIRKIEALQTRSEKELYGIIYDAYDEYMGHPASERNLMLKISVVLSKSGELNKAQSACDKEFKEIVTEMRKILKDNGRDQTLADEAERTYKQKKNAMVKELTDQAYSGGDGSGQSGKWLAEKAGKLS
mgnify:FL=1